MRGGLVHRGKNRWALVTSHYVTQPDGTRKKKQKWTAFHGTKEQAGTALTALVGTIDKGEYFEPTKLTLIEYLRGWLEKSVKPPMRRPATYNCYRSLVETHVAKHAIAEVPLQKLRASDLERYFADLTRLSAGSLAVHHAVLGRAMRKAVKDRLLHTSPVTDLERRKPTKDKAQAIHREHCWSALEARRVIEAAKGESPQVAAYVYLALDTGARKSELNGVLWTALDFEAGTLTIERQLDQAGETPVFGPTKTKTARTVSLGAERLAALRAHKKAQAELRMRNRTTYKDHGLVFAREPVDLVTTALARATVPQSGEPALGQPISTLSDGPFTRVIALAGVKRIKFHGLRHTVATLLMETGAPVHIVAQRLGHANASLTLNTYSHALQGAQQDAATRLAAAIHG